jgi:hypothetical protein
VVHADDPSAPGQILHWVSSVRPFPVHDRDDLMGRRAKQAVLRAVIAMYQHRGIPVVMIRDMRLRRIDRVDAPQHLAARTQDWLGQAAFDHFLAGRAGMRPRLRAVPLRLRTGDTGSRPERAVSTAASWAHLREAPRPSVRLRDHRAGPGGVVRIACSNRSRSLLGPAWLSRGRRVLPMPVGFAASRRSHRCPGAGRRARQSGRAP